MPEFAPGDVFADHRIEGVAGRGGMGVVYRATELGLERIVALKVITPVLAQEEDFRKRFVAESKAAASIEHPNVIPVYHAGERDGVLFIVMRYIDGPDLRALVRAEGRLDPERAAHIVAQVGGALDAAHRHGLVHRDVKPANVLLGDDDQSYLTDFGLTKRSATTDGAGLSRAGGWVGTLGYVAPEQIRGERIDARTDVYALGCVLVHTLTGDAPYMRETDEATLWAHLNSPPPSEDVPPEFEGVIARALAKDPSDRYPSAGDLGRAALRAAGRSATAVPERNVGRGQAAPIDSRTEATAARAAAVVDPDGETQLSPAGAASPGMGVGGWRPTRRQRRHGLLAMAAVLFTTGVGFAVLGGDGEGGGTAPAPPPPPPAQRGLRPATVDVTKSGVLARPNALTIAAGDVWALSNREGAIALADAVTGEADGRLNVGDGASSIAAGFDSVWVTKESTNTVLRINARTRRRVPGGAIEIARPGRNVAVATGAGAVWVGVRNSDSDDRSPESVVRIDPGTGDQREIAVERGVQDLAVGAGAVWVTNRFSSTVTRIRTSDGSSTRVRVGAAPRGIAVGEGAIWVAAAGDDEITRINPRSLETTSIALQAIPERVAVGGKSVWVTAKEAGRLIRIDADTRKVLERVDTGSRPYALDITRGRAVWLTVLDDDGLQRVRFYRPQ
ncbi:MAG TPA: protein kinase [Solirubrobacteraceae bacterium]|nr:protein kinase [Solirubrobacteraceae bacterium]